MKNDIYMQLLEEVFHQKETQYKHPPDVWVFKIHQVQKAESKKESDLLKYLHPNFNESPLNQMCIFIPKV